MINASEAADVQQMRGIPVVARATFMSALKDPPTATGITMLAASRPEIDLSSIDCHRPVSASLSFYRVIGFARYQNTDLSTTRSRITAIIATSHLG